MAIRVQMIGDCRVMLYGQRSAGMYEREIWYFLNPKILDGMWLLCLGMGF